VKSTGLVFAEKPSIGIEPTNLPDRSRFGNHGTFGAGAAAPTPVRLPSGLWVMDFDGVDDVINCGHSDSLNVTDAITAELWIYYRGGETAPYLTLKGVTNIFVLKGTADPQKVSWHIQWSDDSTEDLDSAFTVAKNEWTHLARTYDRSDVYLYKNGVVDTNTWARVLAIKSEALGDLLIGNNADGSRTLDGRIALPKYYNRALSAGKVKQIYESERHWFGV